MAQKETPESKPEEPASIQQNSTQISEASSSEPEKDQNPMNDLTIQEHPVMNGFGTERIGTWASISTTKEVMKKVKGQQLYDFLRALDDKGYNWFNILFEDGTGLYYMIGMGGYSIDYGTIDNKEGGSVTGGLRSYTWTDGGYGLQGNGVDKDAIDKALQEQIPDKYKEDEWYFAHCTVQDDNAISISLQFDQKSNDIEAAKKLAIEYYDVAIKIASDAGCELVSYDMTVVNNGADARWFTTTDGKTYTLLENGKNTEFTIS